VAVLIVNNRGKGTLRDKSDNQRERTMSRELEFLSRKVAHGKLSRRDFLGRASALGVSAAFANTLLSSAAQAAGPMKGGTIKVGI
jgi:peptide/nickel transport system substrate-binding protein